MQRVELVVRLLILLPDPQCKRKVRACLQGAETPLRDIVTGMHRLSGTCLMLLIAVSGCHRQSVHSIRQPSRPDVLRESLHSEVDPVSNQWIRKALKGIDTEATAIREALPPTPSLAQTLAALKRHFFGPEGFGPLRDLMSPENTSVAKVIESRQGTCMGLAVVYQALAERLGLSAHAVATPVHLFMRVDLEDGPRNVELLEDGRDIHDDLYRRRHKISDSSIERGVFLANLTTDEVIAHLLSNQAIALSRDGMIEEALSRYDLAIEKAPLLVAAWYNRGIDLMSVDRVEDALTSFDKAIELHPNDAQAHNNRGIAKARLGDSEGARADWQQALRLEPNMTEAAENLRNLDGQAGSE